MMFAAVFFALVSKVGSTTAPSVSPTSYLSKYNFVSQVAGNSVSATSVSGIGGRATSGNLVGPKGLWQDSTGKMYVVDTDSNCIVSFPLNGDTILSNFAGKCSTSGNTGTGGQATAATLSGPVGIMGDTSGNVYLVDVANYLTKKVASNGILSVYAGDGTTSASIMGRPATSTSLPFPYDVFINTSGEIYVSCSYYLYKFAANSKASLTAGTGSMTYAGDGGPATSASFYAISRMKGDTNGQIYVNDQIGRLRVISTTGIITTKIGSSSTTYTTENLPATSASIGATYGTSVDTASGDIYTIDLTNIRALLYTASSGRVNTYAGTGVDGNTGNGGPATSATFGQLRYQAMDTAGSLFMVDYYYRSVRAVYTLYPTYSPSNIPTVMPSIKPTLIPTTVTPSISPTLVPTVLPSVVPTSTFPTTIQPSSAHSTQNNIVTVAGTGTSATSTGTGGKATSAVFNNPRCVVQDSAGYVYVSEQNGHCVRRFSSSTGILSNFVGICSTSGTKGDGGPASSATLTNPLGIFMDTTGVFKVAENGSSRVRSVTAGGTISGWAGTGSSGTSGDGGQATSALLIEPEGLWGNTVGVIYFTMTTSSGVRTVSTSGIITRFAGTYTSGLNGDGGMASSATLNGPQRVSGDSSGVVYIVDSGNNRVRSVSTANIIITFAGNGGTAYNGENLAATSTQINNPLGDTRDDSNGDYYYSDSSNGRIRVVTGTTGLVTTFAGNGGTTSSSGSGGAATAASFFIVDGLYLNTAGQMYVQEIYSGKTNMVYSVAPSIGPTFLPSVLPSVVPSSAPTVLPSRAPTVNPSIAPTVVPSESPSVRPSAPPSIIPTLCPTVVPSFTATASPSVIPTVKPTFQSLPIRDSPSYKVINAYAFAAITSDKTVITWGATGSGGDSSSVSSLLTNVIEIVASKNAFAALKSDGSVVAWGRSTEISGSVEYRSSTSIVSLMGNEQAFAGLTSAGGVIAFGADCCGGNVNQYGWSSYLTSDVVSIAASGGAFAAVKSDGTVYCWGSKFTGGGVSSLTRSDLKDVVLLSATKSAFAGLTSDGSVVAWGCPKAGGAMSAAVESSLKQNTQYIVSGLSAFVGYTISGGMVAWGSSLNGGDSSDVTSELSDIKYVAHTGRAFAALKSNGSVVVWGNEEDGGDMSSVMNYSTNVSHVVGNSYSFAAVTSAGQVYAWGRNVSGELLSASVSAGWSVSTVYHTTRAFIALHNDGSVSSWGSSAYGGTIPFSLSTILTSEVRMICANDVAFTTILKNGTGVAWGHSGAQVGSGLLSGNYSSVTSC